MMTESQQSNYNYMQTMNADEVAKFKAAIEAANKNQQTTATGLTSTGGITGGITGGYYNPNPCPTCGHCPTCGRGGSKEPSYPYWNYPYWMGNATFTGDQLVKTTAVN